MFDKTGHPLDSLRVFHLVKSGNVMPLVADAIADVNLMVDLNGKIELPETVDAVMNDDSKKAVPVTWNITDKKLDEMYSGGVKKYDIVGTADGLEAHCYVSMIEYNFLNNYSFEDGELGPWRTNDIGGADELYVEKKSTDSLTGEYHAHFWSAKSGTVEFELEQDALDLPSGKYKFTISIMGGDGGDTDIYSYAKIDGKVVKTAPLKMTVYNEWHTAVIEGIEYSEGQTLTVGIYVKCAGDGNGAWGKIDDGLLNSMN